MTEHFKRVQTSDLQSFFSVYFNCFSFVILLGLISTNEVVSYVEISIHTIMFSQTSSVSNIKFFFHKIEDQNDAITQQQS